MAVNRLIEASQIRKLLFQDFEKLAKNSLTAIYILQ